MKIEVIKGTNQIGGCITIIESNGAKIVIDFGEDLPVDGNEEIAVPKIEGLTTGKSTFDAVFITHSHGDHIGLIHYINKDIPIYVEEKSMDIYELTCDFTNKETVKVRTKTFKFNHPITLKDMRITPFKVDHSAYNSAMFLIEGNGRRILHTGDFRNHGRKKEEFLDNLYEIGKLNIDALITEGTCFSREDKKFQTEMGLEVEATELFKNFNQVLVLQSSTNIDRIVSFYKATVRTNKRFIEDLFTATITTRLSKKIPNPIHFPKVSVWIPNVYNRKSEDFKEKYIAPMEKYKNSLALHKDFCMMVKISMLEDIKMLKEKGLLSNACLVYSMWEGYKERESIKKCLEELENLGITIKTLHTSGHANVETMKLINSIIRPNFVIPIHTTNKEKAKEIFKHPIILDDKEKVEI